MQFDSDEIRELAAALAPLVADIIEARLDDRPEWCRSVAEVAAWLDMPQSKVREAISSGRLPCIRIGRSIRIRKADLFRVHGNGEEVE